MIVDYGPQAEEYKAKVIEVLKEIKQAVQAEPYNEPLVEQLQVILATKLIMLGFYRRSDANALAERALTEKEA